MMLYGRGESEADASCGDIAPSRSSDGRHAGDYRHWRPLRHDGPRFESKGVFSSQSSVAILRKVSSLCLFFMLLF